MTAKIATFLKEVRLEIKKVNWPTRPQTFRYTLIVLGISGAIAFFLGGFDFIITFIINKFVL
ncbi:MAG: preprotein translocase subunit SecE [Candidatus Nealsonbacteria bacterium]|nr:preprotein translocase subunit SecE [Candidatus Nealsonbacteria bacterium]